MAVKRGVGSVKISLFGHMGGMLILLDKTRVLQVESAIIRTF